MSRFGVRCEPDCGDGIPPVAEQTTAWMLKQHQTHRQTQCPKCGLWTLWAPRPWYLQQPMFVGRRRVR